jgi:ABC-2 type transport system permease protein
VTRALVLARRELGAYVRSPMAAIVVASVLLIDGILFYWQALSEKLLSAEVLEQFFYNASGTTMIAGIVLSMRLLAEERQMGTFTLLNTAPLADHDIIIGKYMAALVLLILMTVLTGYMPLLIFVNGKVSVGHILVGYLGLVMLGAASAAIGLFASSLTRSAVVAAIVGAAVTGALILQWALARAVESPINTFLAAMALHHQNFKPFMSGTLDLGALAYYLAVVLFFLIAAIKMVEARRWR